MLEGQPNRFSAPCKDCGQVVEALAGFRKMDAGGRWEVRHKAGECPAPRTGFADAAKPVPPRSELETAAEDIIGKVAAQFTALVPDMVRDTVERLVPRELVITVGKAPTVKVAMAHKALPDILMAVCAGGSPMLVGPAGSGKTTLGQQIAQTLKRKFYSTSQVTSEYKLLGFMDAQGHYVRTQFVDAYEHGGVFLFDEIDASSANVMTAINSALANDFCDFPCGMIKRHKDFIFIAAANTFGRGADRQYVGRNQLDAATLDRFEVFEVDYDEDLELQLAGNPEWTTYVQKVRKAIELEKIRHVVSPRASIKGARYLAAGMSRSKVEEACVWKGLDAANRTRVTAKMGAV